MSDNVLQFLPRSNQKADRAFWKGEEPPPNGYEKTAFDTVDVADTAPSEFNSGWVQDSGDCA